MYLELITVVPLFPTLLPKLDSICKLLHFLIRLLSHLFISDLRQSFLEKGLLLQLVQIFIFKLLVQFLAFVGFKVSG